MKIKKLISNSSWVFLEQSIRIFSGFFIAVFIGKSYGASSYGMYAFSLAIYSIAQPIAKAGMDAILVREVAAGHEDKHQKLLESASAIFYMSIIAFLLMMLTVGSFAVGYEKNLYVFIMGLSLIPSFALSIDYYFQGMDEFRSLSLLKSGVVLFGIFAKFAAIYFSCEFYVVFLLYLFDSLLLALVLLVFYRKKTGRNLTFLRVGILASVKNSLPFIISSLSVVLYMKVDQVMISSMLGDEEAGIYSAASKLNEGWLTVLYVFSVSIFPLMVASYKKSKDNFTIVAVKISSIVLWSTFSVFLFVFFLGDLVILYTFGSEFFASGHLLKIIFLSSIFSAISILLSRCLTVVGKESLMAKRSVLSLLLNVVLNCYMIPKYGSMGAAMSTVLSLAVPLMYLIIFDIHAKFMRNILAKAIFFKWS